MVFSCADSEIHTLTEVKEIIVHDTLVKQEYITVEEIKTIDKIKVVDKCPDYMQQEINNLEKIINAYRDTVFNLKFTQSKLLEFAPEAYKNMIKNEN